jgi:hypothetical protein
LLWLLAVLGRVTASGKVRPRCVPRTVPLVGGDMRHGSPPLAAYEKYLCEVLRIKN